MRTKYKLLLLRVASIGFPILIVVITFGSLWFANAGTTSYEALVVSDIELTDDELSLTLDCTASGQFFRFYSYEIERGCLYLKVGSGPVLFHTPKHCWPVRVRILDDRLDAVSSVYLRDGKSARLLYIGI